MKTNNNALKWSAVLGGVTGFLVLGSIFAAWFTVQMLVLLTGLTA